MNDTQMNGNPMEKGIFTNLDQSKDACGYSITTYTDNNLVRNGGAATSYVLRFVQGHSSDPRLRELSAWLQPKTKQCRDSKEM